MSRIFIPGYTKSPFTSPIKLIYLENTNAHLVFTIQTEWQLQVAPSEASRTGNYIEGFLRVLRSRTLRALALHVLNKCRSPLLYLNEFTLGLPPVSPTGEGSYQEGRHSNFPIPSNSGTSFSVFHLVVSILASYVVGSSKRNISYHARISSPNYVAKMCVPYPSIMILIIFCHRNHLPLSNLRAISVIANVSLGSLLSIKLKNKKTS